MYANVFPLGGWFQYDSFYVIDSILKTEGEMVRKHHPLHLVDQFFANDFSVRDELQKHIFSDPVFNTYWTKKHCEFIGNPDGLIPCKDNIEWAKKVDLMPRYDALDWNYLRPIRQIQRMKNITRASLSAAAVGIILFGLTFYLDFRYNNHPLISSVISTIQIDKQ